MRVGDADDTLRADSPRAVLADARVEDFGWTWIDDEGALCGAGSLGKPVDGNRAAAPGTTIVNPAGWP